MQVAISARGPLRGTVRVPSDKSISHRSVIFGALAEGKTRVSSLLRADDVHSSMDCMRGMGVQIEDRGEVIEIKGRGLFGLQEPVDVLNCGNSGTTIRLLSGLMAGQKFLSILTGDGSLRRRPMARVINPLRLMGAGIDARGDGNYAPLVVRGGGLKSIEYTMPVASAQVKSALLLAGLFSEGGIEVIEPQATRDHTERMLRAMGAGLTQGGGRISLRPGEVLAPMEITVPGDISSAAFFLVAASVVPGSEVLLPGVGVNPTRAGIVSALREMGANIQVLNQREEGGEPVGDLLVTSAPLTGITLDADIIPSLIDELPVLAVAMAVAEGESRVNGASELRVKETDRIKAVCTNLAALGVDITETPDGFIIRGGQGFAGGTVESFGDHRIAMAMGVAGLTSRKEITVRESEAVSISYPGFWDDLEAVTSS